MTEADQQSQHESSAIFPKVEKVFLPFKSVMPEADQQSQQESMFKYLNFVHVAVVQAVVYFSHLYDLAKDKSGSLKPGVQKVEDTVKSVLRPVYLRYHRVPIHLLWFIDQKVDRSIMELNRIVPVSLKKISSRVFSFAQCVPGVSRSIFYEVHRCGAVDAALGFAKKVHKKCEPKAKGLRDRYQRIGERYAVAAWCNLHRVPLFPQVAHVMVPVVGFCSEKYNRTVRAFADKDYKVARYLPLVPVKKFAKVFRSNPHVSAKGD